MQPLSETVKKAHGKVHGDLLLLGSYHFYRAIAKDLGVEEKRVRAR